MGGVMKNLFLLVFSFIFAIGCSSEVKKLVPPTIKIPPQTTPEERYNFALRFMLLNEQGEKKAPVIEQTKTWPLGVLISFPSKTDLGYCSTSHIEFGKILTNAHCIKPGLEPEKYYAIFYNKYGIKDLANIEKIEYVGNPEAPEGNDIAILTLKKSDAERWHTTSNTVATVKDIKDITIWSFDPIKAWPQYIQKWKNEYGMVFHPNDCLASHKTPLVKALVESGNEITINFHYSPEKHLFMDYCQHSVIKGNSGSLVTLKKDFNTQVATAFSTVPMQPVGEKTLAIKYRGNKNEEELEYVEGKDLFSAAFSLEYFNQKLKP
jgi:hypothetical protein